MRISSPLIVVTTSLMSLVILIPFLYHNNLGSGNPVPLHFNVRFDDSFTTMTPGNVVLTVAGSGERGGKENHT